MIRKWLRKLDWRRRDSGPLPWQNFEDVGPYERPGYIKAVSVSTRLPLIDWGYEYGKRRDFCWLWLARRLPKRLAYWSYIVAGSSVIRSNEIVPEVRYTELLKRMPLE